MPYSCLLDILEFALVKDDSGTNVSNWVNCLKEKLTYVMVEYIFGVNVEVAGADGFGYAKATVNSRAEPMHLVARFLSYETSNTKVFLKKIKQRIKLKIRNFKILIPFFKNHIPFWDFKNIIPFLHYKNIIPFFQV